MDGNGCSIGTHILSYKPIVETVNFGWPSFLLPVHGFEPVGARS